MSRFKRWQDPFGPCQKRSCFKRLRVCDRHILRASHELIVGMFRADTGIVQPCRDRRGREHLTEAILKQQTVCAVKDTRATLHERRRMMARPEATPPSLDTNQSYAPIADEGMKQPNRIRSATDACHEQIRQPTLCAQDLVPSLSADD